MDFLRGLRAIVKPGLAVGAAGLPFLLALWLCGRAVAIAVPDEHGRQPDAALFEDVVLRTGFEVGSVHGFVTRCVPKWRNDLAGEQEITIWLSSVRTPDRIVQRVLTAFRHGQQGASFLECGDERSAELTAGALAVKARQTALELAELWWVPAVIYHRGKSL